MSALANNLRSSSAQTIPDSLKEIFQLFMESAPDAMVLSNRDGRIILANSSVENMFGYRRGELHGKRVEVLIPPRFRVRHRRARAEYYADPATRTMGIGQRVLGYRKNGSEFPVDINLSTVNVSGGSLVWSAIRDVSEKEASASRILVASGHRCQWRLIPVCAWCKRVCSETGLWQPMEEYIASNSEARFTHGICSDCVRKLDPDSEPAV